MPVVDTATSAPNARSAPAAISPADDDADRYLGKARTEGHAPFVRAHDAGDELVEPRLGDAERLKSVRQVDVAALLRPEPRQDGVLDHRLHLARDARQHDDVLAA